jgi:ribonuclease BN (tRNA processing enzyme)
MALTIYPIRAFRDNYIWALHDGQYCVVVDPGDAAPVLAYLSQQQLTLSAILITHHHPDHVGGLEALVRFAPDIAVYGPASERINGLTDTLREGDTVELEALGAQFKVLDVPGHTAGHIAYFCAALKQRNASSFLRRHLILLRLWALVRRHARANVAIAQQISRVTRPHPGVLHPRIHVVEYALCACG